MVYMPVLGATYFGHKHVGWADSWSGVHFREYVSYLPETIHAGDVDCVCVNLAVCMTACDNVRNVTVM